MANNKYDYEEDYFLNGDQQFDGIMKNMVDMYKTYVNADETGRAYIDSYLESEERNIGRGTNTFFEGLQSPWHSTNVGEGNSYGMRDFLRDRGNDFGIKDLDQRIAVFNDKDHPDTDFDREQQEKLRQELYKAYQNLPDKQKQQAADCFQQARDGVDFTVSLYEPEVTTEYADGESLSSTVQSHGYVVPQQDHSYSRYDGMKEILEQRREMEERHQMGINAQGEIVSGDKLDPTKDTVIEQGQQTDIPTFTPPTDSQVLHVEAVAGVGRLPNSGQMDINPNGKKLGEAGLSVSQEVKDMSEMFGVRNGLRNAGVNFEDNEKYVGTGELQNASHMPSGNESTKNSKVLGGVNFGNVTEVHPEPLPNATERGQVKQLPNFTGETPSASKLPFIHRQGEFSSQVEETTKGSKSLAEVVAKAKETLASVLPGGAKASSQIQQASHADRVAQAEALAGGVKKPSESMIDFEK